MCFAKFNSIFRSGKRGKMPVFNNWKTLGEREVLHRENICEHRQTRHSPSVNRPINSRKIMKRILKFTDGKTIGKPSISRLVNTSKWKQMPHFAKNSQRVFYMVNATIFAVAANLNFSGKPPPKAHQSQLENQRSFKPTVITELRAPDKLKPDKLKVWCFFSWHSIEYPFKIQALTTE